MYSKYNNGLGARLKKRKDQWIRESSDTEPHIYGHVIYNKVKWKRMIISRNVGHLLVDIYMGTN